ncbi:MAG: protoporphyrinogen oxidase HemJ [Bdellovibrionales bacterium]
MQDLIGTYYLWFKALHIIFVISWMAGLLYLPRLFAYHVDVEKGGQADDVFKVMERKLLKIIMNPAMILAWVFGVFMLYGNPTLLEQGWIHVKLFCVVVMTVLHMVFGKWRKLFLEGENQRPAKFYKMWNEVPAVLMIVIVIMAVAEPF